MSSERKGRKALTAAARAAVLVSLAALSTAGCGKQGPPLPPLRAVPAMTRDLTVTQRGTQIALAFGYPKVTLGGQALAGGITKVEVVEAQMPISGPYRPTPIEAHQFSTTAKVILKLEGKDLSQAIVGDRIEIDLPLPATTALLPADAQPLPPAPPPPPPVPTRPAAGNAPATGATAAPAPTPTSATATPALPGNATTPGLPPTPGAAPTSPTTGLVTTPISGPPGTAIGPPAPGAAAPTSPAVATPVTPTAPTSGAEPATAADGMTAPTAATPGNPTATAPTTAPSAAAPATAASSTAPAAATPPPAIAPAAPAAGTTAAPAKPGTTTTGTTAAPAATATPAVPVHYYAIRTYGPKNDKSEFSNQAILIPRAALPGPETIKLTPRSDGILVEWTGKPGLAGFSVYRRSAQEKTHGDTIHPAGGDEKSFLDTGAAFGQDYIYSVTAVATRTPLIESPTASESEVHYVDHFPPPPPADLVVLPEAVRTRLVWRVSEAADLAGYIVYRRQGSEKEWARLTKEPIDKPEYSDMTAAPNQAHFYRVTAIDKAGNESAPSAEVRAAVAP